MDSWFSFVVQTVASSVLAILGFIGIKSTAIGERFLNHHLERKIADLKHSHNEKIEAIRADLACLQDRGRRANELEFDAASKIFISPEMAKAFKDAFDVLSQAQTEQYIEFQHGHPGVLKGSSELMGAGGDKLFGALEILVRTTLRRS